MKRVLILSIVILSIFVIVSCKQDPPHEHTFSSTWAYDAEYHWHEASCGHDVTSGSAKHSWNAGTVTTEPTHTTEGVKTYTCTVCGAVKTETVPAYAEDHTFSTMWSSDANYHWHAATCGHTTLKSQQSAHTWNDGVVTTNPTHTEAGVMTYTCTVCGQTKTEAVPALSEDHTFSSDWSFDANTHWHAATCSHTTLKSEESEHTWNAGVVTTPATCTETGIKTITCIVCGKTKTESIAALGHDYSLEWTVDASATCTKAGSKSHHCSRCSSKSEVTVIPATGHSYDSGVITTPAGCTTTGVKTFTCANCGDTHTEDVPATGHAYNSGVITTPAGCTTTGVKTFTCANCGNTYTEGVPATGHAYSSDWSSNASYHWHAATCEHSEEKGSYGAHTFPTHATAVDQGDGTYKFEKRCTECGYAVVVSTANVGDIGPAGGIVFYDKGEYSDGWRFLEAAPADLRVVFETPTVDSTLPGYSEAPAGYVFGFYRTTSDGSNLWVNGTTTYNAADCTARAIGTGASNTDLLVAAMGNSTYTEKSGATKTAQYAAKLCADLEYNGFDDWFLPSFDEMCLLYTENYSSFGLKKLFEKDTWYATSSEDSISVTNFLVRGMSYYYGSKSYSICGANILRATSVFIRPIRSF